MKKKLFLIHGWIGNQLGILFFIICFSGTISTISHELDWLIQSNYRATPQSTFVSRNVISNNFARTYPKAKITYWIRHDEPYLCDLLYKEEDNKLSFVFANPYTGEIQGETSLMAQLYLRDLHYYLFIPFQIGNYIVLLFGFLMLVSVISALYFYKSWWKKLFTLDIKKGSNKFSRSLHRVVGLWTIPFIFLIVIISSWYFAERANIAGIKPMVNPKHIKLDILNYQKEEKSSFPFNIDYDKAVKIAEEAIPHLKVKNISPAIDSTETIYLMGNSNVPLVRQRANRVYINPYNYKIEHIQNAATSTTIMWINDIVDPLHFGYWGGITTKIIWFIFGLFISILILSGIYISLKRKARLKQKGMIEKISVNAINTIITSCLFYFMLKRLHTRYEATILAHCVIFIFWTAVFALLYYLLVFKIRKTRSVENKIN
ncbi:PepSY-associated TM helix domain-containing protein [Aquimarina macrocephali]|uniref:PepSY-associated TM helix domain-containing protein n=1 Tax=Aquimarina macrocephali TaxID=666563 RepID=UPI000A06F078|nr:PepSY-associated TM helix domain-containing protein [Aquimarina macrocephali]